MSLLLPRILRLSLRDLLDTYTGFSPLRFLLSVFLFFPALRFALYMRAFERDIRLNGLASAAEGLFLRFYAGIREEGPLPPATGGVLILGNHPGAGDSLAVLSRIERTDLRIVSLDREFLRALPSLYARIIPVREDERRGISAVRGMQSSLREGRAVLLYPAGEIEPDPASGAAVSDPRPEPIKPWSEVVGLLVLLAGRQGFDFRLCPVLIGGVLPESAMRSLIPWSRPGRETGERRAVGRIVGFGAARKSTVTLRWGEGIRAADLLMPGGTAGEITALARSRMIELAGRKIPGETG